MSMSRGKEWRMSSSCDTKEGASEKFTLLSTIRDPHEHTKIVSVQNVHIISCIHVCYMYFHSHFNC